MYKNKTIVIMSVLIALSVAVCVYAFIDADDVSATSTFGGGAGTVDSPYLITSVEDLKQLATDVNAGTDYSGKYFEMTKDIDLSGIENWTPIGTKDKPFMGVFDGKNHKIVGLKINSLPNGTTSGSKLYFGLFGATSSDVAINSVLNGYEPDMQKIIDWSKKCAVLKNIVFTDVEISVDGQTVGALVGKATNTYIDNIKVKSGTLLTMGNSGGVVGYLSGSVVINVSTGEKYTVGTVDEGGYSIGGIVGAVRDNGNSAIINSTNNAKVEVYITSASAAGILGNIADKPASTLVYGCVNNGEVSIYKIKTESKDTDDGKYRNNCATGIVGHSNGQQTTSIINCTNNGKIINNSSSKAGSLAGISDYTAGLISGCVNNGEIIGNAYIRSGIISHNYTNLVIRNCDNKEGKVATGGAIVADIIALNQGGITVTEMVVKSPEEIEKYIPVDFKFSFTINNVTCPKGTMINFNPTTIGTNVTIKIIDSLNGSTFKINKGNGINVYVEGTDVSVSFDGDIEGTTIEGTTSVHCNNIKVTLLENSKLTRFYLYGDGNEMEFSGHIEEGLAIGSSSQDVNIKSNKNTITLTEGSIIVGTNLSVYGDENIIKNSGRINDSIFNHGATITGNNNTFINEKDGYVNHYLKVNGKDNTVRNFGQIMTISFVGTGMIVNEPNGKIEGENRIVNIPVKDEDGKYVLDGDGNQVTEEACYDTHKISVGTSLGANYVNTTVDIHNYGTIKGLTAVGSSYILYTAGFDNIAWYNHEGSKIIRTNSLFCFQQKGNDSATPIEKRGLCNINFYYADNTILQKDGSTTIKINNNSFWTGNEKGTFAYGILKDLNLDYVKDMGVVTEKKIVPIVANVDFTLPIPAYDGCKFDGWYDGNAKYETTKVSDLTSLPSTLKAKWIDKTIKIDVSCTPSIGGTVTGASSYDNGETVTLKAVAKDGYRFLRWNDGTTDATKTFRATTDAIYTAEFVKLVTVTFDNNGNKAIETIDEGNKVTKPDDPSRSGYVFSGWYDGTSKWDFNTVVNDNITLTAKWVKDSNVIVISYKDGKVDFNVPIATVATKIIIELPNNVSVTLEDNTVDSVSGSNIAASMTKLTSDMFEITVNKDGVMMNASMNITLPYTSGKGTPSVYYYPESGDKILMGGTIDAATSTITFQTNHNSVYGIVYATPTPDVPVSPDTPTIPDVPTSPTSPVITINSNKGTNQNVVFIVAIATVVASLFMLATVIRKK